MMITTQILVPLIGSFRILFTRSIIQIKRLAMISTFIVLLASVGMWSDYDSSISGYQLKESFLNIGLAVDGIRLYFLLLTRYIMPIIILRSWTLDNYLSTKRSGMTLITGRKVYFILILILEACLIAVFTVTDLIYWYISFEAALIPLFLLVGIFGSTPDRIRAAFLLMLYTVLGSLCMLTSFLSLIWLCGSSDFESLWSLSRPLFLEYQYWIWAGIFIRLAIKTPLWPVHIWLYRAHSEANARVSMILAALILKLATYGYMRVLLPILPEASRYLRPLVQTLCAITLIYASLTLFRQTDVKCLIAYSSVAHMSIVVYALFRDNLVAIEGALLLGLSHAWSRSALFFLCGYSLYQRYHSRVIAYYTGLTTYLPIMSTFMFIFILANMRVPLTANWLGEIMCLLGRYERSPILTRIMSLGILTSAIYSILLFNRICFGTWSPYMRYSIDVTRRERYILFLLLLPALLYGILPNLILDDTHLALTTLLNHT